MTDVTILGPSTRPMVALGGANSWKTRTIKGIFCSFQWVDLRQHGFDPSDPDHACAPCMCLFRPASMNKGCFVVPQKMAYLYGTKRGEPTARLLAAAFKAASTLEFNMRDRFAILAIADIVIEGLPDLILMPSEPPASATDLMVKAAVHGIEAVAKINGKIIHEEVL